MIRYVNFVIARRRWVIAAIVLATLFFALQIGRNLRVVINPATMLPQQHPSVMGSNLIESVFGVRHLVVVGVQAADGGSVYRPEVMAAVTELAKRVATLPSVKPHTVLSPTAGRVKAISGVGDELVVEPLLVGEPNAAALADMRQRVAANPLLQGLMVSRDERMAAVSFGIDVGAGGYRPAVEPVQVLVDAMNHGAVSLRLGGAPVFYATVERYSQRIAWLFPLALLIIGLIHLEAFRTWQGLVLPLVTAVLSVVWALGIMGAAQVPMDAFNATTPILILAVAAGHAVQILKRYYEEFDRLRNLGASFDARAANRLAVQRSLLRVGPPMLMAGAVAAAGLFSLTTFEVATIRTFGLFTGLGVLSALFIELSFIPAVRCELPPPGPVVVRARQRFSLAAYWDRAAQALADRVTRHHRAVVALFAGVAVVSGLGLLNLNRENSTKSYFGGGEPVRLDDSVLNEHLAGTNTLYVAFTGAIDQAKDPALLALMERTQRHIESLPEVGKTLSLVDFLRQMNRALHEGRIEAHRLPATREEVSQLLLLYGLAGDPTDFEAYVDAEHRGICMAVWLKNDSSRYSAQVVDSVRRFVEPQLPPGVRLHIGGSVPQTAALSETLVRGKLLNIAQMMVVVLVAGALAFRSALAGLYLSLPLLATVLVNFGLMGLTGIPLNTPTSVIAAMTIGIGADYAIYLLYRMREDMQRSGNLDQAIASALRSAGLAVVYVASAIVGGYSVMLLSKGFLIHVWFGVLIVSSMVVSAAAALVLMPALVRACPPNFLRLPRPPGAPNAPNAPDSSSELNLNRTAGVSSAQRDRALRGGAVVLLLAAAGMALWQPDARAQAPTPAPAKPPALDAAALMACAHQATRVEHSLAQLRFVLVSPGGQERTRETFAASRLLAGGEQAQRVLRFLAPGDVRNTATLIAERAGGDDDIWIYLPALKKTRRVSADNKRASFVGTDLSYADMAGHKPQDWTHRLLRAEDLDHTPTQVIESFPRDAGVADASGYSRRLSWVVPTTCLVLKTEFHDAHGRLLKTAQYADHRLVDPTRRRWQAMQVQVRNHQTGHQTRVQFDRFDATTPVREEFFSRQFLETEQ